MRLLTDDVERLSEGRPALADPQPELAGVPARLTVTVGYGMGLLEAAGLADQAPAWLAAGLPAFSIDKLQDRWTGGDLLLQVAAEDPVTVSHAVRVLLNDSGPFATVRWVQSGFHRPANTAPTGITGPQPLRPGGRHREPHARDRGLRRRRLGGSRRSDTGVAGRGRRHGGPAHRDGPARLGRARLPR